MEFKGLKKRLVTGLTLIALVVVLGLWGNYSLVGKSTFLVLMTCAVMLCAFEFGKICFSQTGIIERWLLTGVIALPGLLSLLATFLRPRYLAGMRPLSLLGVVLLCFLAAALLGLGSLLLERKRAVSEFMPLVRDLLIGLFLIGLGGSALILVALDGPTLRWLFVLVASVCLNDIGAYFGGQTFRGPQVAPQVSPSKTISGSVCGLMLGTVVFWASAKVLGSTHSALGLILCGGATMIAAQIGDLLKSLVKRLYAVKDSGTLLPGHGGFLDRLDGLLLGAPVLIVSLLVVG